MNLFIGTLLVLFFAAGGAWGWWRGSRDLKSPPERNDCPAGTSRRDFARRLHKRYKRRRILLTVGGAVGSAVGGFALLVFLSTQRWLFKK